MAIKHIVKQGDCISSIAFKYDLFPEAVWDHPDNADLKKKRKDPNALLPGDSVVIPDKETKEETCATDQLHRFRRKGVPEKLRIRFLDDDDNPRKGIPYILDIRTKSGRPVPLIKNKTDSKGFLEETIPPDASEGEITLGEGDDQKVHTIKLGHLDPIDTLSGIQARLNNMGYDCGEIKKKKKKKEKKIDEMTRNALRTFQRDNDLNLITDDATEVDKDTRDKIEKNYSK